MKNRNKPGDLEIDSDVRLIYTLQQLGNEQKTAQTILDLLSENECNVPASSLNRVLNKLEHLGLVQVVGTTPRSGKGKPSYIYEVTEEGIVAVFRARQKIAKLLGFINTGG